MEKINIVELLKDCPQGMELDSPLFEGLEFDGIVDNEYLPIRCRIKNPKGGYTVYNFTKYGCWLDTDFAKCVIFPKGKTTWKEFRRYFNDGDIVATTAGTWIGITEGGESERFIPTYCVIMNDNTFEAYFDIKEKWAFNRLATEEEKEKLFKTIKENGYKWNAETKTLEKLIEPKFKVGDRIKNKNSVICDKVIKILEDCYLVEGEWDERCTIDFDIQDNWELVPNKFDITTLVPFESRVLVRNSCDGFWMPTFWGIYEAEKTNRHLYRNYLTTKGFFLHCIPYNDDTKHLMGTTDDCSEFYKTWE